MTFWFETYRGGRGNRLINRQEPMTDKKRIEVAKLYRRIENKNAGKIQRKAWVPAFLLEHNIDRATLYRWLKRLRPNATR